MLRVAGSSITRLARQGARQARWSSQGLPVDFFFSQLQQQKVEFFAGVPDSLLKDICAYITDNTQPHQHVITANEGSAIAMCAGYHLTSGTVPVAYMQNSGFGNTINPVLSLCHKEVYSIPMLMVVGWRGEPGKKDEPQHVAQGRLQEQLLASSEIPHAVVPGDQEGAAKAIEAAFQHIRTHQSPFALLVKKGTFSTYKLKSGAQAEEGTTLTRESAIKIIAECAGAKQAVISTTGMASRELYEHRVDAGIYDDSVEGQARQDFLTVGSMGHTSAIALGCSLAKPEKQFVALDGDGSFLMHMGNAATVGQLSQAGHLGNFRHIVINNGAHDSVGGQPTAGGSQGVDLAEIASAAGYQVVKEKPRTEEELREVLATYFDRPGPLFLEVLAKTGSRSDLGRPKSTPVQNKDAFMKFTTE